MSPIPVQIIFSKLRVGLYSLFQIVYLKRHAEVSIKQRFIRGSFWSITNTIVSQGLNLLTGIILCRTLGKGTYGEFGLVSNTAIMFSVFCMFGFNIVLTRSIAENKIENKEKTGRIIVASLYSVLIITLIVIGVLLIYIQFFSTQFFGSSKFVFFLSILMLNIYILSFTNLFNGGLAGFEDFKAIASSNATRSIVYLCATVLLIPRLNVLNAIIILTAANFSGLIFLIVKFIKNCKSQNILPHSPRYGEIRDIFWVISFPTLLTLFIPNLFTWLTLTTFSNFEKGFEIIAGITVISQWQQFFLFLPNAISFISLPILSSFNANDAKDNRTKVFVVNHIMFIFMVVPLSMIFFFFPDLILSLYGTKYQEFYPALVVVSIGSAFSTMGFPAGIVLQAKGRMWFLCALNLVWGIILYCTNLLFLHLNGGMSYALAFSIAHLFLFMSGYLIIYREIPSGIFKSTLLIGTVLLLSGILSLLIPSFLRYIIFIPNMILLFIIVYWVLSKIDISRTVLSGILFKCNQVFAK